MLTFSQDLSRVAAHQTTVVEHSAIEPCLPFLLWPLPLVRSVCAILTFFCCGLPVGDDGLDVTQTSYMSQLSFLASNASCFAQVTSWGVSSVAASGCCFQSWLK